jgi:hypothetical protein
MASFQAKAAASPSATVINSANLSKISAVNVPSFPVGFPDGPAFPSLHRMLPREPRDAFPYRALPPLLCGRGYAGSWIWNSENSLLLETV